MVKIMDKDPKLFRLRLAQQKKKLANSSTIGTVLFFRILFHTFYTFYQFVYKRCLLILVFFFNR